VSEATSRRSAIRSYEDIEAYQRAMALLAPVHRLALRFPDYERYELASPANIAEGYAKKRSVKEFKAYLSNALGSANEMIVHLKVAVALGYVDEAECQDMIDGYSVVVKQLHRLIQRWRRFEPLEDKQ
jgi:four helix bundle protein